MIETKLNSLTPKNMTLKVNPLDDDNRSYASSFDNCGTSISNSDQTSIMDAQYKPHIQLKFSCFCLFMFMLVWLLAACLACATHFPFLAHLIQNHEFTIVKIFSFLFSLFLFVYSVLQFSFYVLSRDEFSCVNMRIFYPKCFEKCSIFKVSPSSPKLRSPQSLSDEEAQQHGHLTNPNAWYFEPTNENVSTEEKRPLHRNDTIDCAKNRFKIYEAVPKIYETRNIYATDKETRNLVEESSSDDQAEKEHKESICDVIFSAKKSPSIKQSALSTEFVRTRVDSNTDSLSTSNSNTNAENIKMGKFPKC